MRYINGVRVYTESDVIVQTIIKQHTKQRVIDTIQEYLTAGGLFNPEAMNHQAVRDLLLEVRQYLENE